LIGSVWYSTRRKYLPDFLGLLVLIIAILWFASEMIWDGKVPFYRDLGTYFYPLRYSLAQAFRANELPLWDRHAAMGFPLLADFQSGSFYPPHLLFIISSFFTAIRLIFLLHYSIAAIGAYALCRRWRYTPAISALGAVMFVLGGTMVSLTNLLNHFQTAVWLPWSVFLWEHLLERRSWKNFMLLSFVLVIQLLAGSPEIYVLTMGLMTVRGVAVINPQRWTGFARPFYLLLLTNVFVAFLAAVQLLPTAELLIESRRQEPIPYQEAVNWSLNPLGLFNLVFLDKEVSTQIKTGVQVFFGHGIPFIISYYMGAIALFGACFWVLYSSWKEKWLLLILVGASLTIALGDFTPLYSLLYRYIPPFAVLRYPEKFFFFTHGLLLFAVIRGISEFIKSDSQSSKRGLLLLMVLCSVIFLFYGFLRFSPESLMQFVAGSSGVRLSQELMVKYTASVLVNLERQLGLWCGLLLLFYAGKSGYLRHSLANGLLVIVVFVDLSWAHKSYQYLIMPDFITQGNRIIKAPNVEPSRLFYYPPGPNLHPSYFVLRKEPKLEEIYSILFNNLFPNSGVFHGFDYMQDINALGTQSYVNFLRFSHTVDSARRFRLFAALNVKYIVSFTPLDALGITLARHFPEYPSWLYEIKRPVPRVYVVSDVGVEKEPQKILQRLSSEDFDPLKTVILDRQLIPPLQSSRPFVGRTKIQHYGNHQVTIQASLSGAGVLVLADSFYPGWRVLVNGVESEILRANYFFRGVALAAGDHNVEFRYQPGAFMMGGVISLLTLASTIAATLFIYFVKRKKSQLSPTSQF